MLVSVIIPCYNAERWIGEAITSCLRQTYRPIEIVVIDDGSTDGSLSALRRFGTTIQWESGPRRGACYARNRGFSLSRGKYIQFLDADDYLLPEKIERQVFFLEESGADVVYGDWRKQQHRADGRVVMGEVEVSGPHSDILESLLGGWLSANMTLLMRREVVLECGGWDEAFEANQDRDFFIRIAMSGADIRYQSGCYSIYRRYGNVTVSTADHQLWLDNLWSSLNKAESKLDDTGRLTAKYRKALAQTYFSIARNYYDFDRSTSAQMLKKAPSLYQNFSPDGSTLYRLVQPVLGIQLTEMLASHRRRVWKALRKVTPYYKGSAAEKIR